MRKARGVGWIWAVSMAMSACGGSSQTPAQAPQGLYGQPALPGYSPPPATKTEPAPKKAGDSRRGMELDEATSAPPPPAPAAPAPATAAGAPAPPEAPGAMDPQARYARANAQLSEARHQFDVAAGARDCASACRALDSMERAAGQICELARSTDERRTCRAAEDQVGSARERVKSACGECQKRT